MVITVSSCNKPTSIPDIERLRQNLEQLEKETVTKSLQKIVSGRELREVVETGQAVCFNQLSELTSDAELVFAEMQDLLRDYLDVYPDYRASEKLELNKELQRMIGVLSGVGFSVGTYTRNLRYKSDNCDDYIPLTTISFVVGLTENFPDSIRVPKKSQVQFA